MKFIKNEKKYPFALLYSNLWSGRGPKGQADRPVTRLEFTALASLITQLQDLKGLSHQLVEG